MKYASCLVLALIFSIGAVTARSAQPPQPRQPDDSLYVALGGKPGITAIVDTMLNNVADDMRIVHYFASANIANLRHDLIVKFCAISGGPCHYTGLNMVQTHRGLHVTAAAFNAMVEDLQAAMTRLKIPLGTQNRLLARLVPMRNQIIER
ncbi:MAG TPA: group 1 truncated hemoglobin [Gammaproteobacteria bacterium]|nr:group 1 truncated hemoglobin [Gammaproteobacteria bacterium]